MLASRRAAHCRVRPGAILQQQPAFGVFWGRGGGWLEPPWSGRTFQSWEIPAPSFLLDLTSMLNKSHLLTGGETNAVSALERTSKWGWKGPVVRRPWQSSWRAGPALGVTLLSCFSEFLTRSNPEAEKDNRLRRRQHQMCQ